MSWCEAVRSCFQTCCGGSSKETDPFASDAFQSTYTVRRISSFGQTIINEKGEEKEIGRHASIVTYDGGSVPWTSKPAPVQPGVTYLDVKNQIEKMPTIVESSCKTKQKHRWKKSGISPKKDSSIQKTKTNDNVQLKSIKYISDSRTDLDKPRNVDSSISHEDIFSKCKKSITPEDELPSCYLTAPSTPFKSISTPDLVFSDQRPNFKVTSSNSKDSLPTVLKKMNAAQMYILQKQAERETEAEKLAKQHGLDLSMYTEEAIGPLNVNVKPLTTSEMQVWSEDPIGNLVLSIHFDILQKLLNVNIEALKSLCESFKEMHFPTLIKVTLVGSKKIVKTSKRIEDSCRSKIDQSFSFLIKDMDFRSMRITIYNAEWLGKHDAIGHGLLSLQHLLEKTTSIQLKLYSQPIFGSEVGMIQVYLSYDGTMFHLTVDKLFNFDSKLSKLKLYTKIAYYSQSKKIKERISNLAWCEIDENEISFNHSASFKVDTSGKKHSYIVITVKSGEKQSVFKTDKTLGRITFGPCFYYEGGKKLTPWGKAIINKEQLCYAFKIFL